MIELRLRWLVPAVLLFSLWLNYSIVSASSLHVDQFAPVVVRSVRQANYGQDPLNLTFPAVDPQLFDQVLQDQGLSSAGQSFTDGGTGAGGVNVTPVPTATPQPGQATATPQPGLDDGGILPTTVAGIPTVVGAVPTIVGAVPTVIGAVPTVIGAVPTVIGAVPTVVNAVPTVIAVIPTAVPAVPTVVSAVPTLVCTLPLAILCP